MCDCWEKRDKALREKFGLKISDACQTFVVTPEPRKFNLRAAYGLPLQRADGARPKRKDIKFLEIAFCPFCGQEYDKSSSEENDNELCPPAVGSAAPVETPVDPVQQPPGA